MIEPLTHQLMRGFDVPLVSPAHVQVVDEKEVDTGPFRTHNLRLAHADEFAFDEGFDSAGVTLTRHVKELLVELVVMFQLFYCIVSY